MMFKKKKRKDRSNLVYYLLPLLTVTLIWLLRCTGILEYLELAALDNFFHLRSSDFSSQRIIVVKITEKDISKYGYPISDDRLLAALNNIQQQNPKIIGIDLVRDSPVSPDLEDFLATNMIIGVDQLVELPYGKIQAIPILKEKGRAFGAEVPLDIADGKIRRGFFYTHPQDGSPAANIPSFAWGISWLYLKEKGIEPKFNSSGYLQIGAKTFKRFKGSDGGYWQQDDSGYSFLVNWYEIDSFPEISISDVIEGSFSSDCFAGKIVLVGSANISSDLHSIPYTSKNSYQRVYGVHVQANLIENIIATVLENRPIIWTLSQPKEFLYTLSISYALFLIVHQFRKNRVIILTILAFVLAGLFSASVFLINYLFFLYNGAFLPLVPPLLSIPIATFAVTIGIYLKKLNQRMVHLKQNNIKLKKARSQLEQSNLTLEQKVLERTQKLSQTVELLKATQEKLVFENALLQNTELKEYQYQIGGTVPIDSPTYVVRKADKILYKALKKGQFCYIFNARQMGKSSLRAKIMHQLSSEGYLCAALDLTEIVSDNTTEAQFYNSIIFSLAKKLGLLPEFDYRSWKKDFDYLSSLEKLGEFVEEILLKKIEQKIIIFIDEIDTVLDLQFSIDCFFAFWRSLYNKRADFNKYRRLNIVLIGRTAPSYLIQSPESTPFNIGCSVPLEGFKIDEVERSLINGLQDNCEDAYTTIQEVLKWTGGQPFLTQKICNLISSSNTKIKRGEEANYIHKLIKAEIIEDWENKDRPEHLKTITNKLTKNRRFPLILLEKYQEILLKGEINDEPTWECLELFLSGIVRKEAGKLKIYNPIYETVFDRNWVEKEIYNLRK